jgi:hypothetical protein
LTRIITFLGTKRPWSKEELRVLPLAFKNFYRVCKPPGAEAIKEAVAQYPMMSSRTLPQIKSRVFYEIIKSNKKQQK